MSVDRCPHCGGTDLYESQANFLGQPAILGSGLFLAGSKPIRCLVCLACGLVIPFLAESQLNAVRREREQAEKSKAEKQAASEKRKADWERTSVDYQRRKSLDAKANGIDADEV